MGTNTFPIIALVHFHYMETEDTPWSVRSLKVQIKYRWIFLKVGLAERGVTSHLFPSIAL